MIIKARSFLSLRNRPTQNKLKTVPCLGVFIDDNLSWEPHIKNITARLSRMISLIRNLKNHVPAVIEQHIFILSVLYPMEFHYGGIFVLQKKIVRIMTDLLF